MVNVPHDLMAATSEAIPGQHPVSMAGRPVTRNEAARIVLDGVPDGWAKVDGRWHLFEPAHVLVMDEGSEYVIEHDLACRLAGTMATCHVAFAAYDMVAVLDKPFEPGRYRVRLEDDDLVAERIDQ